MPRKYPEIEFKKRIRLISKAKLTGKLNVVETEGIDNLNVRIEKILSISGSLKKNHNKMLFFVMYDIANDKVRREVSDYLIQKGCVRVQKSIFFAALDRKVYNEISTTIKAVQEVYENDDSIFFVPVSTDEIRSMKVIGKNVDFDIIMGNRNTLFF